MKILYIFTVVFFISHLSFSQISNPQLNKIDIYQYQFGLEINEYNDSIYGSALIRLKNLSNNQKVQLDFASIQKNGKGMKVKKLEINGKDWKNFIHKENKLEILTNGKKGEITDIHVEYSGIPADGLIIGKNKYGQKSFFGDNWPNRAHFWLPVIDHPSDKALVSFDILAPKNYDIIASGKFISRIRKADKILWKYRTKVPLATKVMVFGATEFNIKNYGIFHDIPISGWIYKNSPIEGLNDYAASMEILKYYDSIVGPYSYSKLANVQSKTRFGGMENAGNIFYFENSVDGKARVENLIAHEVAHQWFGNSVSEKNWKDIWLSEGFATYLTDLFLEHKYGKEKMKERMKMERDKIIRYNTYVQKPIIYNEKDLMKLLNPNSYEKGAWVLHMLRNKITDKNFFAVLKKFYKDFRNKNASTEDFIRLAENISQKDLKEFFNQWLYQSGIPELKLSKTINNKNLTIKIIQKNGIFKFDLPVFIKTKKDRIKILIPIRKKENTYTIRLKSDAEPELIIDPDVEVLYKLTK